MGKALIIGCGGVASVVIHKCCQNSSVFEEIMIASRTKSKCDTIKEKLEGTTPTKIRTAKVDADNVDELVALIDEYKPDIVMNIALPYQDLTIMDACLKCGVNYMDTANYEPEDTDDPKWREIYEKRCKEEGFTAYFDYSWQWAYKEKFEKAGLTALLGSGFDPGVTRMLRSTCLTRSTPSTFSTATAATTVIRLPPTLTPKSTCARFPHPARTGRTATGSKSRPCPSSVNTTLIRLATRTCTCCIMKRSNRWRRTSPALSASASS
mgnify:CR=1 FL=1